MRKEIAKRSIKRWKARRAKKRKCQSEVQKMRRSKGEKKYSREKCKRWKSRRGGKKYPQRSIKDGKN
jgi:hypothetical protein